MPNLQKYLDKVRALLNRAAHPTEENDLEAQIAEKTAKRLMLEHSIEPHELEGVSVEPLGGTMGGETIVTLWMHNPQRWVLSLAVAVGDHYRVKVHYVEAQSSDEPGVVTYYGVQKAARDAAYGFEACLNQIVEMAAKYQVLERLWERHPLKPTVFAAFATYKEIAKAEMCYGVVTGLARRWAREFMQEQREGPQEAAEDPGPPTALAIDDQGVADTWLALREVRVKERPREEHGVSTGDGHHTIGESLSKFVSIYAALGEKKEEEAEGGSS